MTGRRIVAVAVDAAGAAGNRPYSYSVPHALADLAAGEAVLVEFGRRQALGIVLGPGIEVDGVETKPIVNRVRTDGPLLPELGMRLAAWISDRYLAPPALTLRAMLPPGMLERLELVAERRPTAAGDEPAPTAPEDEALLQALTAGPRPVRAWSSWAPSWSSPGSGSCGAPGVCPCRLASVRGRWRSSTTLPSAPPTGCRRPSSPLATALRRWPRSRGAASWRSTPARRRGNRWRRGPWAGAAAAPRAPS